MQQQVSLEIMAFVEQQILPRYNAFGPSHGILHVQRVISTSLDLARRVGADMNMAYVIAAYHDLGMSGPRAIHHLTGGRILAADARLKKWFSTEQIKVMKEAVEDHRASASHEPRSIYGKIVAEADRDLEPQVVFARAVDFGLEHYPNLGKEEQWKRFRQHIQEKYGPAGYLRLWIPDSPNEQRLKEVRALIAAPKHLRLIFDDLYEKKRHGA